jgi:hypothetical protein
MVRTAAQRKAKYEAKIDADVMRSRILAQKADMVTNMEDQTSQLAALEMQIKGVIEGQTTPIYGSFIPMYLNVGRALYAKQRKFGTSTFQAEAAVILDSADSKGLEAWALTVIAELFGVTWS